MAFIKRLADNWMLGDGILDPFLIGTAKDVLSAAVEAGHAADPLIGMDLMADEWVYCRSWTYKTAFDAPEEGDERTYLRFDELRGSGVITVNGCEAVRFESGETQIDISGLLEEGENELTVCFEPMMRTVPGGDPMPKVGITGGVWLKTGNYITLKKSECRIEEKKIILDHEISAHTAGKFNFAYVVSLDGALIKREEFAEKLPATDVKRSHVIELDEVVPFDHKRMDETTYDVRLTVERAQIGCETARFEAVFGLNDKPMRIVRLNEETLTEALAEKLLALGADGVAFANGCPKSREKSETMFGLRVVTENGDADVFAGGAFVSEAIMDRETRGVSKAWPVETPLWRLRGNGADLTGLTEKYADRAEKRETAVALSRYEQARSLRKAALAARMADRPFIVDYDMPWDSLFGPGLIERGGCSRPAYEALRVAWQKECVWCETEGVKAENGVIRIPVFAAAQGDRLVNVTVRAMTARGDLLTSASYPLMLGKGGTKAGEMTVDVGNVTGAVILRAEMRDGSGSVLACGDDVWAIEKEDFSDKAPQDRVNGKVKNIGNRAIVSAGRVLMPGEEADEADAEWLSLSEH